MGKTKAGTHPNVPSKREVRTTCYPEFPTRRPGEIPNPNTVDYLPNGRYPKEEQREDEYTSGVLDFNTLQKQKDQLELEKFEKYQAEHPELEIEHESGPFKKELNIDMTTSLHEGMGFDDFMGGGS